MRKQILKQDWDVELTGHEIDWNKMWDWAECEVYPVYCRLIILLVGNYWKEGRGQVLDWSTLKIILTLLIINHLAPKGPSGRRLLKTGPNYPFFLTINREEGVLNTRIRFRLMDIICGYGFQPRILTENGNYGNLIMERSSAEKINPFVRGVAVKIVKLITLSWTKAKILCLTSHLIVDSSFTVLFVP